MLCPRRCLHCASIGVEAPVDMTCIRGSVPPSFDRGHLERPTGVERSPGACWRRAGMPLPWRFLRSGPLPRGPSVETTWGRMARAVPIRCRPGRTSSRRDQAWIRAGPSAVRRRARTPTSWRTTGQRCGVKTVQRQVKGGRAIDLPARAPYQVLWRHFRMRQQLESIAS